MTHKHLERHRIGFSLVLGIREGNSFWGLVIYALLRGEFAQSA